MPYTANHYTFAQWTQDKPILYVESPFEYDNQIHFSRHLINDNSDIIAFLGNGYYRYDYSTDKMYKIWTESMLGENDEEVVMIPIGKSLTVNNDYEIACPPHLFTVETQAGRFEDCLCMGVVKEEEDGKYTTIRFYAPGIGFVLEEELSPYTETIFEKSDFVVTNELIKIDNNVS